MSHDHFGVHDGVDMPDTRGMDLGSWDDARSEAIRRSGKILGVHAHCLSLGEEWRMEVTDERRFILFRLDITELDAPSAGLAPASLGAKSGRVRTPTCLRVRPTIELDPEPRVADACRTA